MARKAASDREIDVASADPTARSGALALPAAGWIMGPWQDALLFIGTPLVIVPLVLLAQQSWSAATLYLAVASFGAVGHHLPGMMRAYGDRGLFARFRVRFVVAPLFLVAVCLALTFWNSSPLKLVVFGWGLWHGFMQAHGIARIYDAKAGSVDAATIRLDFLLLGCWFLAVVLLSPLRLPQLVGFLYDCGLPPVSPGLVHGLQVAAVVATVGVSGAWVVHALRRTRAGSPPSPLKLALHLSTIAFWTFCNLSIGHVLLAILMFEIFHDVQYLAIVWIFNRRRADGDPAAGAFTRFLFRQRGYLVVLYVGMVAGYGSLNLLAGGMHDAYGFDGLLGGLVSASTLLHFYYDGFIWKLRESETSRTLGVRADAPTGPRGLPWLASGAGHAAKWALLVVPLTLVVLNMLFLASPLRERDRYASLAAIAPDNAKLQSKLAELLAREGDYVGAIAAGRRALAGMEPYTADRDDLPTVKSNLVTALMLRSLALVEQGDPQQAAPLVHEAASLDPGVPGKVRDTARAAAERAQLGPAGAHYAVATLLDPDDVEAWIGLARVRSRQGRVPEARTASERAAALAPEHPAVAELRAALAASG
jgi:hypothetical protein